MSKYHFLRVFIKRQAGKAISLPSSFGSILERAQSHLPYSNHPRRPARRTPPQYQPHCHYCRVLIPNCRPLCHRVACPVSRSIVVLFGSRVARSVLSVVMPGTPVLLSASGLLNCCMIDIHVSSIVFFCFLRLPSSSLIHDQCLPTGWIVFFFAHLAPLS